MKVAVLGDGKTGSAVQNFLNQSDAFELTTIDSADIIVTSPGIAPVNYPKTNVEIISDIEFAVRILREKNACPKIIGITGTNGKTTVASGLAHVLNATAFGNIGVPLISHMDEIIDEEVIIIELSSYQLYTSPTIHCDIAVIINITPDHLEWHETFENYEAAKLSVIKTSEKQEIYCPKELADKVNRLKSTESTLNIIDMLPVHKNSTFFGVHNEINTAIIHAISKSCGLKDSIIQDRLNSFNLPAYRCEKVLERNELVIINDSKSTNMASTLSAVSSIDEKQVLILAGKPKGAFTIEWSKRIDKLCDHIYACGYLSENQRLFPEAIRKRIVFFPSLKETTAYVLKTHSAGVILFSPAGASFDEYANYEDRGAAFNQYVHENI